MLIGFNNDVQYRGKVFHIQTEDRGLADARIETQLFFSGAILDTVITSYAEILERFEGAEAEERIKAKMKASHKSLFRNLHGGKYDALAGLESREASEESSEEESTFTPSQDRVPAAAEKLERGDQDAIERFSEGQARQHVDLNTLKSQLSKLQKAEATERAVALGEGGEGERSEARAPAEGGDEERGQGVASASPGGRIPAPKSSRRRKTPSLAGASSLPRVSTLSSSAEAQVEAALNHEDGPLAWQGCEDDIDGLGISDLVEALIEA